MSHKLKPCPCCGFPNQIGWGEFSTDLVERASAVLTNTQFKLFKLIAASARGATKDELYSAMYPSHEYINGGPEPKIIDVMATHIRRRIEPLGVTLSKKWGAGAYQLVPLDDHTAKALFRHRKTSARRNQKCAA